jgi:23S rRNA pseudouridine955/2504/2580 synthase
MADPGSPSDVIEALRALRPDESLELVHRLDRDTSGCLLVARKRAALVSAHALLREGELEKHYTALVVGHWRLGRKTIDAPVLTHARQGGERVVRVHRGGKIAVSIFDPGDAFSRSGDAHGHRDQDGHVRTRSASRGFRRTPVAGDEKYGDRESNAPLRALGLRRMFLHAASVSFRWPDDGTPFRAEAPLPVDLETVLAKLPAGVRGRLRRARRV